MEFQYQAVTKDGQKLSGVREAESQTALARELREQGLFLIWAQDKQARPAGPLVLSQENWFKNISSGFELWLGRVGLLEKTVFVRHLSLMIRAGFSLNKALETLARQTPNRYFAGVLRDLAGQVTAGKSFHDSLSEHRNIFPPVVLSMVKVGEASGKLEETLRLTARYLKRENALRKKIQSALVYPALVVAVMAGVGAVMVVFVLPQLAQTFSELNVPLPLSTQVLFKISNFLSRFWYAALAIIAVGGWLAYFGLARTDPGRKFLNFVFLKLPIFSELTRKLNSARFARTLNSLLSGGVSLPEALKVTSETLGNFYYRRAAAETIGEVEKGRPLSAALARHGSLFPPMVTEMVAVGEETGSLTNILRELARFFESEVSVATKGLSSVVEPAVMILVGLAVGVFALSIIQPIYSIGTGL